MAADYIVDTGDSSTQNLATDLLDPGDGFLSLGMLEPELDLSDCLSLPSWEDGSLADVSLSLPVPLLESDPQLSDLQSEEDLTKMLTDWESQIDSLDNIELDMNQDVMTRAAADLTGGLGILESSLAMCVQPSQLNLSPARSGGGGGGGIPASSPLRRLSPSCRQLPVAQQGHRSPGGARVGMTCTRGGGVGGLGVTTAVAHSGVLPTSSRLSVGKKTLAGIVMSPKSRLVADSTCELDQLDVEDTKLPRELQSLGGCQPFGGSWPVPQEQSKINLYNKNILVTGIGGGKGQGESTVKIIAASGGPSSQSIKDSLPKELIEKIKAASHGRKTIAIIEPVTKRTTAGGGGVTAGGPRSPQTITCRNPSRGTPATPERFRSVKSEPYHGPTSECRQSASSLNVSVDHDYCSPTRPGRPLLAGRFVPGHKRTVLGLTTAHQQRNREDTTMWADIRKFTQQLPSPLSDISLDTEVEKDDSGRQDSGLESGQVSEEEMGGEKDGLYDKLPPYLTTVAQPIKQEGQTTDDVFSYNRLPSYIVSASNRQPSLLRTNQKGKDSPSVFVVKNNLADSSTLVGQAPVLGLVDVPCHPISDPGKRVGDLSKHELEEHSDTRPKKRRLNLEEYRSRRLSRAASNSSSRAPSPEARSKSSTPVPAICQKSTDADPPTAVSFYNGHVKIEGMEEPVSGDVKPGEAQLNVDNSAGLAVKKEPDACEETKCYSYKERSYRRRKRSNDSSSGDESSVSWSRNSSNSRSSMLRENSDEPRPSSRLEGFRRSVERSRRRRRSYSSSGSRSSSPPSRKRSRRRPEFRDHRYSRSARGRSRSRSPRPRSPRSREQTRREQLRRHQQQEKQRQVEERRVVYVGRIEEGMLKADLRRRFEVFGPIVDISVHFRERGDNYGFVTFKFKVDAYAAVEHGNDDPTQPKYDLCFGGRRAFCKERYYDLDDVDEPDADGRRAFMSFDDLLSQVKKEIKK